MLDTARAIIRQMGHKIGLDDEAIEQLISINQEHVFELSLSNGQTYKAFRVQHNN